MPYMCDILSCCTITFYEDQNNEKILQQMENQFFAGNEELRWRRNKKKGSEDDYQELTMKFMMVIYVKCFT